MRKQYKIVDTNIFLIDPIDAIYGFAPRDNNTRNDVVIPGNVLEEIERFKNEQFT